MPKMNGWISRSCGRLPPIATAPPPTITARAFCSTARVMSSSRWASATICKCRRTWPRRWARFTASMTMAPRGGQSLLPHARRAADDLDLWPPQSRRPGLRSRHRPVVGDRARSHRRRRGQHHRTGQELRLGRRQQGAGAWRDAPVGHWHDRPDRVLQSVHRAGQRQFLCRRQIPRLEEQPVHLRHDRPAPDPAGGRRSAGSSRRRSC